MQHRQTTNTRRNVNDYLSRKAKEISPYAAGAQPKAGGVIKLNTNENPYPPSPEAMRAMADFNAAALRLYPRPDGGVFKTAAANVHNLPESYVFCGNGSDEVLGFAFDAFFDGNIMFPDITYSFYPVWADLFGISYNLLPLGDDFTIPVDRLKADGIVLANPNAPTGIALTLSEVEQVLKQNENAVVIVDEAYAAFGAQSAAPLVNDYPNLLVVNTLSKSHSLAGLRAGYALGQPHLIGGLERIKDSFNSYPVDSVAQAVAAAALNDTAYTNETAARIVATRERTTAALAKLGFNVLPSKTNFVFATRKKIPAADLQAYLETQNIYVRRWDKPRISEYLRISIGTDAQMDALIDAIKSFISSPV